MNVTDPHIITLIQKGNSTAFEQVFHAYYEPLCRFASRFIYEEEEVEEIVQELFLQIWEKRGHLAVQTSLKSYLYRSTRNRCLNYIKHQKVRERYVQETAYIHFGAYQAAIEPNDLEKRILDTIAGLPDRCREIFEMSRFEGLKYREISDILEISPKTVEVQMSKALKVLRQNLQDYITVIAAFFLLGL